MSYLKYNKNNKKILNAVIVGLFCLSNAIPTVSFAAVSANSTANLEAKETDSDKSIAQNIANNSSKDSLGKKDLSDSSSSSSDDSKKTKEDELVTLNKKQNEVNSQQKNKASTQTTTSYIVTDKNGESVTVTTNPCYMSTTDSCKQIYSENVLNSAGEVTSYRSVPLNTLKYTTSNQSALTSNMEAQLNTQINMKNSLNNASANGSVVTNYITNALSSFTPKTSWSEKLATLGMAIAAGIQAQQQIEKQAASNKVIAESRDTLKAIDTTKNEIAQQKRDVLQQTSKRYVARLTPTIPTIDDNLDVTLTLVTPSGSTTSDDYTIKAKVLNQDTKKWVWLEVFENKPITVEKGNWTNRPLGKRTVEIVYTFKDNTKAPEQSTITYNVGQMANAILTDGKNVTNSVTALAGNADILNYNQSTKSVAGKITKANWTVDGSSAYCKVSLTDDKKDTGKYAEVSISTNNIPEDKCNDKLVGNYASFADVSATTNDKGEYVFQDLSNSSSVNYSMSEATYDDLESSVAKTTQEAQAKKDTSSYVVDPKTGVINVALPGEIGVNYVYIPGWNTCLAVSEDSDGTISFKKADGTAYTDAEIKEKIPATLESYKKVTFGKDENGKIYAMLNGKVISSGFNAETLATSSKSTNLSTLPTLSMLKENNEGTTYSGLIYGIVSNVAQGLASNISNLAQTSALKLNTSNLVTGAYSMIPENSNVNDFNTTDAVIKQYEDKICQDKNKDDCAKAVQQLENFFSIKK